MYWKFSFGYLVLFTLYGTACDIPLLFGDRIEQFFFLGEGGGEQVTEDR